MSALDFCAEVLIEGRIRGAGLGDSMAVWDRCMGYEYTDGLSRGRLRRDYGLVEIIFEQYDTGWHATGIEIQAYRLGRFGVGIVPQVLSPYFGAVENRVDARELLETVAAKGIGIGAVHEEGARTHAYRVDGSGGVVYVLMAETRSMKVPSVGDVWTVVLELPDEE
ncbi:MULTISPECIES: hypothetical protein [Streptomyces]|uniref:hypothetical protein n=1 Tax=Streptomyces TaxID=1883 RepID=UPI000C258E33|nr:MULTISPECIES: hypothetical protein [Streptomyces]MDQ0295252.1 hypothetical protein [Streptomyces sp. DSM 41037]NEE50756.1 hypothetical protein [Streptomyces sp. SID8455]PJM84736.1 hypothetical protein CH313_01705 [Streptomyces sp. TSRI0384-2]GFH65472.1 hypothetical protein Srut_19860 [Streptomyces rutgersensis]